MVKIEQLSPGTVVWFVRDGKRQRAFLHQLLTRDELTTLEVVGGTVVYSIDEQEVVSRSADTTKSAEAVSEPTTATTAPTPAEPPVVAATETKPKIVFPAKSKRK